MQDIFTAASHRTDKRAAQPMIGDYSSIARARGNANAPINQHPNATTFHTQQTPVCFLSLKEVFNKHQKLLHSL